MGMGPRRCFFLENNATKAPRHKGVKAGMLDRLDRLDKIDKNSNNKQQTPNNKHQTPNNKHQTTNKQITPNKLNALN